MANVIVLGGCGAVGSVAVKTLANLKEVSEIIIGDINKDRADELVKTIGSDRISAKSVDVLDESSLKNIFKGADIILNCTGPFFRFVTTILKTVIECGVNYVDICDDVDVTLDILKMDAAAKTAGITALIGMGSSPGVTNLLGKFAAETLLDDIEAIDIYHAHGGEPVEGAGVVAHRLHCMTIDCPQFIDGELKMVKFFEPDGVALQEEVDFYKLGEKIRVYPYPHPEQVTMPNYVKAKRVTNRGTVLPDEYYDLIKEMCRFGLHSKDAIQVGELSLTPFDFTIAYLLKQREIILKETDFGVQRGCLKVVATGIKDGKSHKYIFSMASEGQAMGEGTGIPAAMGVALMLRGKIDKKGVLPPEACVNPADFLGLIGEIMPAKKDGKSFEGLLVESIDENGETKTMTL